MFQSEGMPITEKDEKSTQAKPSQSNGPCGPSVSTFGRRAIGRRIIKVAADSWQRFSCHWSSNQVFYVVLCFVIQLILTSLFWNRYIEQYHLILESPAKSDLQAVSFFFDFIEAVTVTGENNTVKRNRTCFCCLLLHVSFHLSINDCIKWQFLVAKVKERQRERERKIVLEQISLWQWDETIKITVEERGKNKWKENFFIGRGEFSFVAKNFLPLLPVTKR